MVCMANEIQSHPCLESFASYYLDKQTYYFYPQCEDGKILRRSLMDGTEQNVLEALVREDAEETVQEAEMTDEEDFYRRASHRGDSETTASLELQAANYRKGHSEQREVMDGCGRSNERCGYFS
ncbi:PREDICTED: uncharacterized protein LOC105560256 isoform X2 [Vollenhovia emeryi]|uniref:uncharacterized protein LOC105560256 isoform X2 n=1 Tax=Vollenhovia emeryi TaxID=411798 RepID=UPI0005F39EA8|nr:PREDICTED: uncharacterized protein LOC105560256 isoform X2 [Vollenhovia emeryi]